MGLNHLQSLICTYSADDLRPLIEVSLLVSELGVDYLYHPLQLNSVEHFAWH